MKKLILCGALLAFIPAIASAQNSNKADAAASQTAAGNTGDELVSRQRQFNSYISMLEAGVSRNTQSVAQDATQKAMMMMQETIARQSRTKATSTDAEAATLQKSIDRENKIYSEVKMASVNAMANAAKITPLLKEFMKML